MTGLFLALSEFQDDQLSFRPRASQNSSPDDFDLIPRPPPPLQRDTDSDRDSRHDPPLLPSSPAVA